MKGLCIAIWLACGIVAAGLFNASFHVSTNQFMSQDNRDRWARRDCVTAIALGLVGGPVSLALAFVISGAGYDGLSFSCRAETPEGYRR